MKRWLWFGVGLVLGGVLGSAAGILGVSRALMSPDVQRRIDAWKRPEDTEMVLVAAADVPAGTIVTVDLLYAVQIAPRLVPNGVHREPEDVVGARVLHPLTANTFVRVERLTTVADAEVAPR